MTLPEITALRMIGYYGGMPKYIQHFLKVERFSSLIAAGEELSDDMRELLSVASYTHDIGIKISHEKYGSSAGKYQELEGPPIARVMLSKLGADEKLIERVEFLIAHHHTYDNIDAIDWQILVEADFLVNIFEEGMSADGIASVRKNIFKTKTGTMLLDTLFPAK